VTHFFDAGPDAPFIARLRVKHDGSRRVLAAGRTRGGSPLLQIPARFGDLQETGTREAAVAAGRPKWLAEAAATEAAGIAVVAAAGRRAWELNEAAKETGDVSVTPGDITERVERGAALLDEKRPGWWQFIDLDRLDIEDGCDCVAGQLDGTANYMRALRRIGLSGSEADAVSHGFESGDDEEYAGLTEAWRTLIARRRELADVTA
jgi:hypothetical protein